MKRDTSLEVGLLIFRLSTAAFLLVWTLQKLLASDRAQGVFKTFYTTALTPTPSTDIIFWIGVAQLVLVLAFAVGFARFWTYGAVFLMHAVSTGSSWSRLVNPYQSPNALFWAAVPVLAALLLLFLVRHRDRLSLDGLSGGDGDR